jgi:hypothetical protein
MVVLIAETLLNNLLFDLDKQSDLRNLFGLWATKDNRELLFVFFVAFRWIVPKTGQLDAIPFEKGAVAGEVETTLIYSENRSTVLGVKYESGVLHE